jgi:hypothetical protein
MGAEIGVGTKLTLLTVGLILLLAGFIAVQLV